MSSLINDDIQTVVVPEGQIPPNAIMLCDEHQTELWEKLGQGYDQNQILQTTHILFSVAAKAIGTKGLVAAKCPICGIRNFDYVAAVVSVVKGFSHAN